jgi:peptide chain release factor 3
MNVCRMRHTPVMVFVNKLDRPGRDPFDLLDEIEEELEIQIHPLSWPVSMGQDFRGVYNRFDRIFRSFRNENKQTIGQVVEFEDLEIQISKGTSNPMPEKLEEELELIAGVYPDFRRVDYLEGKLAPLFFGSALNNFGVRDILDCFVPGCPVSRHHPDRKPDGGTGGRRNFRFRIQDTRQHGPNHRDRLAFIKIASGKFERNKSYIHVRTGRKLKFSSPTSFMAEKSRSSMPPSRGISWGVHDTGNFKIGDAVTEGEKLQFQACPAFRRRCSRYVENDDPSKFKQLSKGPGSVDGRGGSPAFRERRQRKKDHWNGGSLQFDVIQYRLQHEYGARCRYEQLPMHKACWIESEDAAKLKDFRLRKYQQLARDKEGREVYMAESPYALQMARENFPEIAFHFCSEF